MMAIMLVKSKYEYLVYKSRPDQMSMSGTHVEILMTFFFNGINFTTLLALWT